MPDQLGAFAEAARAREQQLVQRLATSVELDRTFEGILHGAHQYNLQARQRWMRLKQRSVRPPQPGQALAPRPEPASSRRICWR
jgi:hypothetical protein